MKRVTGIVYLLLYVGLVACGGGATKESLIQLTANADASQVVAGSNQTATASANLNINTTTGKLDGFIKIDGRRATDVHIHEGFAGQLGPKLLELVELDEDEWLLSGDVILAPEQISEVLAGKLYFKVLFSDPDTGETSYIRGQILPAELEIYSTVLLPPQNTTQTGRGFAAITVDRENGLVDAYVTITEIPANTITIGHVHDVQDKENVVLALQRDLSSTSSLLFRANGVSLSPANIEQLVSGRLYVNMHSGETPNLAIELTGGLGYDENKLLTVSVGLSSHEVVQTNEDAYSAAAHLSIHMQTGEITGFLTFPTAEVTATAVHMHEGYAGITGDVVPNVAFSSTDGVNWTIPEDIFLTDAQMEKLLRGEYYLNLHYANGSVPKEIRGQIVTGNTRIYVARLQPPETNLSGQGFAAVTINLSDNSAQFFAQASGTASDVTHAEFHDHWDNTANMVELTYDKSLGLAGAWHAEKILTAAERSKYALGLIDVTLFHQQDGGVRNTLLSGGLSEHVDTESIDTDITAAEVVSGSDTAITAFATMEYDHHARTLTGGAVVTSLSGATEVNIRSAFAGEEGDVVVALESQSIDTWVVPDNIILTVEQAEALEAGKFYFDVRLPEIIGSERIRGQILPDYLDLYFTRLMPVESGSSTATGFAALTLNKNTRELVARVQAKTEPGISLVAAHIHDFDSPGFTPVTLNSENISETEFLWKSPDLTVLNSAEIFQLESGKYYIQLHRSLSPAIIELTGNFPDQSEAR